MILVLYFSIMNNMCISIAKFVNKSDFKNLIKTNKAVIIVCAGNLELVKCRKCCLKKWVYKK